MLQYCNPCNLTKLLNDYWAPQVIATFDDYYIKIAKLKGALTWLNHSEQDEVFFILSGTLTMEYQGKNIHLSAGDLHVVPKGVQHNPVADKDCLIMVIEHKTTKHTGDINLPSTRSIEEQLSNMLSSSNKGGY